MFIGAFAWGKRLSSKDIKWLSAGVRAVLKRNNTNKLYS